MSAAADLHWIQQDPTVHLPTPDTRRRLHHAWHALTTEAIAALTPEAVARAALALHTAEGSALVTQPALEWPLVLDLAIYASRLPHAGIDPWRGLAWDGMARAEVRVLDVDCTELDVVHAMDVFSGHTLTIHDGHASRLLQPGQRAVMRVLPCGHLTMATQAVLPVDDETLFELANAVEEEGLNPAHGTSDAWAALAFRLAIEGARREPEAFGGPYRLT